MLAVPALELSPLFLSIMKLESSLKESVGFDAHNHRLDPSGAFQLQLSVEFRTVRSFELFFGDLDYANDDYGAEKSFHRHEQRFAKRPRFDGASDGSHESAWGFGEQSEVVDNRLEFKRPYNRFENSYDEVAKKRTEHNAEMVS